MRLFVFIRWSISSLYPMLQLTRKDLLCNLTNVKYISHFLSSPSPVSPPPYLLNSSLTYLFFYSCLAAVDQVANDTGTPYLDSKRNAVVSYSHNGELIAMSTETTVNVYQSSDQKKLFEFEHSVRKFAYGNEITLSVDPILPLPSLPFPLCISVCVPLCAS